MRRSSLLVLSVLLLVACTTPAPTDDGQQGSSSSLASSSSSTMPTVPDADPPFDMTSHSGTYLNADYGFMLSYPTHFEPLQTPGSSIQRSYHSRIEDNTLMTDQQEALSGLVARDREVPSDIGMTVAVYPLEGYSFVNIYDDEYLYDAKTGTWSMAMAKKPFTPQSRTYAGLKIYEFGFGDAGHSSKIFAILNPAEGVAVEITIGGCLGCIRGGDSFENVPQEQYDALGRHVEADTELVLRSFRWVD